MSHTKNTPDDQPYYYNVVKDILTGSVPEGSNK